MRPIQVTSRALRLGLRLGFVAIGLALAAMPAAAQMPGPNDVRMEIDRTQMMLDHAAEVVRRSGNPRAMEALQAAARSQDMAREHLRAHRYAMALQATFQARELARRAMGFAQQQGDLEQRARRGLEEGERALEHARQCAGDPPSENARRILDLARARLEQAREAFHEQKFRIAFDLSMQVRRLAEDICGGTPARAVEQLLEDVARLLERAIPQVEATGDPNARALLGRARELLDRARERFAAQQFEIAAQHGRQAREFILRALRMAERPPDAGQVQRALEDAARDLEDVAQRVRAAGNAEAMTLVERAENHLERARRLAGDGRARAALAEIRVARNLARRAAQLAGIERF